ncbi:unnamed protein product [Litomosoides sigmodontis]|uniref:G-protein coupled receptors family 1 profile domain-containing protein n=1 Tax=Litomosoides sigmodontis TaxID=42156 RepID=A0A3P6TEE9_LITSI|nr:unnamed protein product [Litomosoides sigmodontis]
MKSPQTGIETNSFSAANLKISGKNFAMGKMIARSFCIIALFLILPLRCEEKNMSIFDIRNNSNTVSKYVAIVVFSFFILYGIVGNLLLATVIRCRENHYSRAFIFIISQLIICNLTVFFLQLVYIVPGILGFGSSLHEHVAFWSHHVFVNVERLCFVAILQFTFLLAVNRFVVLILPKFDVWFESKLLFMIGLLWLSALAITISHTYFCTTRYHVSTLSWIINCTKQSGESGKFFIQIYTLWKTVLPVAMFIIYIVIFYSIRRKRYFSSGIFTLFARQNASASKTNNYERSMLIQAALTCISMEIEMIFFEFSSAFAVKIFGTEAYVLSRITVNCLIIFNCSVLPTVYFIYNKRARRIIKQHFLRLFLKDRFVTNTTTLQVN